MENQLPIEKQPNQTEKKEWVSPEMTELNLNKVYTTGETALEGLSGT